MSDIAIRVENLSKQYKLGETLHHDRLKDLLTSTFNGLFRRPRSPVAGPPSSSLVSRPSALNSPPSDYIWALKDISFDVKQGETLGIIGSNGAGKSTLLKILSRITDPTVGRAEVYGRVGSLLEVGTGFDRELTGRENIYLNGAILGMAKREIDRKFDEIVDFSGVEKFIDTPVKRYSSGMYVRLAFAVAAHLEPEILIVDEVLSVGDAAFQKKCIGKMGDVAREGRTVLFVSHNMVAIESFCNRCFLLKHGRIEQVGDPKQIIGHYLVAENQGPPPARNRLSSHPRRTRDSLRIMREVTLFGDSKKPVSSLRMGSPLSIEVRFLSESKRIKPVLGVVFKTAHLVPIFGVNNRFISGYSFSEPFSQGTITCHFDRLPLMPGQYFVDLYLGDQYRDLDVILEATSFQIEPSDVFGTGRLPPPAAGTIYWPAKWTLGNGEEKS